MTAKIIDFPGLWHGPVEPAQLLAEHKADAEVFPFKSIVIVGEYENGDVEVKSSSNYQPDVLWLLKMAEQQITAVPEPEDDDPDLVA